MRSVAGSEIGNEVPQATGDSPNRATAWALSGLSLSMLMASLDTSIANAGLPTMARALGAPFPAVQWIVLAYLLAVTTLIVSVGRLGDLAGRRRMLLAGIAVFTIASVGCGAAPSLGVLIAARAVQGMGAATMMSLTIAFVGETVARGRTGSAMGLLGAMSAIGTALGPSFGGILISLVGWRARFLVNVPIGVVALILAFRFLPSDHQRNGASVAAFDTWGTALLSVTLASCALAVTAVRDLPRSAVLALATVALAGLYLFVHVEARAKSPMIRLTMFRDSALNTGLVSSALVSTVIMSTLVVGPFYLSRALGLDAVHVGLVLSVGSVVVALFSVPAGRLADRFGAPLVAAIGLSAMAVGSLLVAASSLGNGIPGYVVPIVVVTSGYSLFQTSNNTTIMSKVTSDQRGVMSGMLSLARNLGLITGASVMGAVFAWASGFSRVEEADAMSVARGMQLTFAVAAILMVVALVLAVKSRPKLEIAQSSC